mmetsp:Transcript_67093/g.178702  ORF Transcript_67093/g.178702 Transcript_67093/m.178702 type:complete len:205 (-) Transcript_67093:170-784(-)
MGRLELALGLRCLASRLRLRLVRLPPQRPALHRPRSLRRAARHLFVKHLGVAVHRVVGGVGGEEGRRHDLRPALVRQVEHRLHVHRVDPGVLVGHPDELVGVEPLPKLGPEEDVLRRPHLEAVVHSVELDVPPVPLRSKRLEPRVLVVVVVHEEDVDVDSRGGPEVIDVLLHERHGERARPHTPEDQETVRDFCPGFGRREVAR